MAIMGFNAGAEMSQLRTQQTLAMQAAAPAAAPAGAAPAAAADPAAAAAAGAAAPSGPTADAAMAGAAVQAQPPQTGKIVMQSVLKGAMTGASVALGIKSFGPVLGKIGFFKGIIGNLPKVGPPPVVGAGLLGFLGKLPLVGKLMPMMARTGLAGFAITALIGAGIGAIGGFFAGQKKAKQAAADHEAALAAAQAQQAAQQQQPVGDPVNTPGSAPAPVPVGGRRAKSWIISRQGSTQKTGGSFGSYTARKGDTIAKLAERFHTTPAEIKRLNPDIGSTVEPGTKLKLKRRVVPDAKAWVA